MEDIQDLNYIKLEEIPGAFFEVPKVNDSWFSPRIFTIDIFVHGIS